MKKIYLILSLLMLPFILLAQSTGIESLESQLSQGLFPNQLDAALNVGEAFSLLGDLYLYGGIGNLNNDTNFSTITFSPPGTIPATLTNPYLNNILWTGMFMPGAHPYSLFEGTAFLDYDIATPSSGTVETNGGTTTVNDGTTDISYRVINTRTTTNYSIPFYERLVQRIQYLTAIGPLTTGLMLGIDFQNTTDASNNNTSSFTEVFDDSTTPGTTIPQNANDYTINTEVKDLTVSGGSEDPGINNTVYLQLPLYLGGALKQTFNLGAGYNWTDGTRASSGAGNAVTDTLAGVPKDPADSLGGSYTNTVADLFTRQTSNMGFSLDYDLEIPGLFGINPANSFTTGLSASMNLLGGNYAISEIDQTVTFTPGGSSFTNTTRSEYSATYDVATTLDFGAELRADHTFYFQLPGITEFGIKPTLSVGYASTNNNPTLTSRVDVTKTDADNDGAFTSATDTIQTETWTYTNTVINAAGATANKVTTSTLSVNTSLPSSLKIQPEKWWFGIIMGASPYCTAEFATVTTNTSVSLYQNETVDGADVFVGNPAETEPLPGNPTSTRTTNYSIGINHRVGVFFDLNDAVHLSIDLLSAGAGGVWDIRNLVVQGIISLPHGKAD